MSRIADVLKKAAAQRDGKEPLRADAGREPGSPEAPWGLESERTSTEGAGGPRRLGRARTRPAASSARPPHAILKAVPAGVPRRAPAVEPDGYGASGAPPRDPPVLARYWEVARRRWRLGLLILLVVVGGVAAGIMLRTPVYRASGLLELRPESMDAVPVQTLFTSEKIASDELETQYGILKSQTLAERVLTQLHPGTTPDLSAFEDALMVNPQRGSRLVEIAFTDPDPSLAAMTVNAVVDNYLQIRMEDAQQSAKWLEQQLHEAQRRLEASERELQAFVRARGIEVLETGKGETAEQANERLQLLHDALARAQAERMEKQSTDETARSQGSSGSLDSPVVQTLTVRLADLRREHARLTSVFREDYPAVRTVNDQIAELERALAQQSQVVVSRGQRDYQAALRKEALLRQALDEQNRVVQALAEGSDGQAGYEALKRELVTNQEQFAALGQKLKDVSTSAALKAASVGIVDRAKPPSQPDGFPMPIALALSMMVGLVLAGGGAVLREHFDTSMRTVTEVESYLGVRTLGAIPSVAPGRSSLPMALRGPRLAQPWRRIDDQPAGASPLAEAFAALRSEVLLQRDPGTSRVLMITSAQSEEGKTTISVNLALSLARLNHRVLLVDGNLRYPCVQRALGLPDGPGLVEFLEGGSDWRTPVRRGVRPNLDVLVGAEPQSSPADLLSLPKMGRFLDAAAREYDFVVVDSPALLMHPADVHSLAAVVDDVLFAVRQGWTPREVVALGLSQLDRVSGVVLNRSNPRDIGIVLQDPPRTSPREA